MNEPVDSINEAYKEIVGEEPHSGYLPIAEMAEIDTTQLSDEMREPMWLADAWDIGRNFAQFRTELNQALVHGDEFIEENDRYNINRILSNMLTMEMYLAINDLSPDILTQMKQHRQRLAEIYLIRGESQEEDSEAGSSEDLEEGTDDRSSEDTGDGDSNPNEVDSIPGTQKIQIEHIYPLEDKATDWLYIISEQVRRIPTFPVVNGLRVDLASVIEEPNEFFREDVWDWMDRQPKDDFIESCTCLATDNPTASMMLSLRAVEYCLREWYEFDTGRNIENRTWGQVISELEDHYEGLENRPSVLSNLDYLKTKRNEVSHPDDSPNTREAERMLYRIEGTITDIYGHISVD